MTGWRRARRRTHGGARHVTAKIGVVAAGLLAGSMIVGSGVADVPPMVDGAASRLPSLLAGADLTGATPCTAAARACVDLAAHTAWLLRDGEVVRGPVPFVDGDAATPTPRGAFTVEWKARQWTSREYLVPMPYAVFFAPGGIAFHEGRQDTPSAGCVKLGNADAVAFFDDLQVGDKVEVV